jgi:hypothetical protein
MARALGINRGNENFVLPSEILQGRLHQKPRRRSENNIKMYLIYVPVVAGQYEPLIPNGYPT